MSWLPFEADSVLFVHSTGTSPSLWKGVPAGAIGNRRKLCPANIGYAEGERLTRGVIITATDDARHILSALPTSGAVHLVAHSYGALIALHAAQLLGSRLASLFFYEPVVFGALVHHPTVDAAAREQARSFANHPWFLTDEARGGSDEWLAVFVDYWNRPGSWARMPEAQKAQTRALGWKMFQEVRACFFDDIDLDKLGLAVPTTVACGDKTTVAAVAMAKLVARSIPGTRLVELLGASHMAPLMQPDRVYALLAEHFARLSSYSTSIK